MRSGFTQSDDGVALHWRAVGSGPVILCANGVGVGTFFWKYLVEAFRDTNTVVVWDYRGHGLSSREINARSTPLTVRRHAMDLWAVADAACPGEPVLLVGHSMGCQVVLEAQALGPARTAGLVLMLGSAGRTLSTFFDNPRSPQFFRAVDALVRALGPRAGEAVRPLLGSPVAWWGAIGLRLVDPYYTRREDLQPYLDHLASMDFRVFTRCVRALQEHDAWPSLPGIAAPVLVVAAENDQFTPVWCSRRIAATIPGAELLVLADASHAALIEQPETIHHRLRRFIADRLPGWAGPRPAP